MTEIKKAAASAPLPHQSASRVKSVAGWVLSALGVIIATLLVFVLVEGMSSLVIFAHRIFADPPGEHKRHTQYDELLGWVNIPNIYIPDRYGPGVYLRTNSRGFRNNNETSKAIPTGRVRVVCSGDSFTQGYGVDNDHAICQRLATLNSEIEPVNMGQAGYGLDQAFLWYQRDGTVIDHNVHVFSFITDDFLRMQLTNISGYPKPVLRLRNGKLVAENIPVPKASFLAPWLVRLRGAAVELRTTMLAEKIQRRSLPANVPPATRLDPQTQRVASQVFATLAELNKAKNSRLVLVHLPTKSDYASQDRTTEALRPWLRAEAARRGIFMVDLVEDFRKLPSDSIDSMFIPGHWHYTVKGNEWAARIIYERLLADPVARQKLTGVARS